jgi:type II secretory pathway pseudopilin PulG
MRINQKGFTLIEVVLTAAFIGTAIAGIGTLLSNVYRINQRSQNLAAATQAAQSKLEDYRNTPFTSIPIMTVDFSTGLPAQLPSPKTGTVTITLVEDGLKQVEVDITFREGQTDRNVKVTTYVTSRGINK